MIVFFSLPQCYTLEYSCDWTEGGELKAAKASKVTPTDFNGIGIKHQYTTLQAFNIWIYYKLWSNFINASTLFQVI